MSAENRRRTDRYFVSALHSICLVINQRFIHPISVAQNIVLHSYARSRTACHIFGNLQPSGSYRYLEETVSEISKDKPCFPQGDIYVAFDNQQIVGRDFRVSVGATQPTSIVTSFAVYKEDGVDLRMQYHPILTDVNFEDPYLWQKYENVERRCTWIHQLHRLKWIQRRLDIVEKEQHMGNGGLQNEEIRRVMATTEYENGLEYHRIPESASSCRAFDMENLLLNPNSYATVAKVLDVIVNMSEATSPDRHWITVVCDGAPYTIAANLIKDWKECKNCGIVGKNISCESTGHDIRKKFQKIVLKPGAGHMELNLVRSIFGAFFDIFIRPVAEMLGFTTPRALDYCKKALDHHKSWQILQVANKFLVIQLYPLPF